MTYQKIKKLTFALGCLALFGTACKDKEKQLPECFFTDWQYEGEQGPDKWAGLCEGYATCGGTVQSPVNIAGAVDDAALEGISLQYETSQTLMVIHDNGLLFSYDIGSSFIFNHAEYVLLDFHMHTHSEHTVDGANYPMEIHFRHKNYNLNKEAIVCVFVEEGTENDLLNLFIPNLPTKDYESYASELDTFNAVELYPTDRSYFTYGGSLSIPPCTENVDWIIMEHPIQASVAQIAAFENIQHQNFRPLQPLNGRGIRHYKS